MAERQGMSEREIIDCARYLGWTTHDQSGAVTPETQEVASNMKGTPYGVMLPSMIATEYDNIRKTAQIKNRLEYLRGELRAENISYGELAELQSLVGYIDKTDAELLEAAGVPESVYRGEGQP